MEYNLITFIVTKTCQLACRYCYLVGKNNNERMSLDMARKSIDYILRCKEFNKINKITFDFIGGEPLLEINLINDICDYIIEELNIMNHRWKNNYKFSFTTNGLLYADEIVQQFIKKHKEHIEITLSIDGNKKKNDINRIFPNGKGSYDKVINNVKLWVQQFPNARTNMVVSSADLPYIYDSVIHLFQIGLKRVDIVPVVEDTWNPGDEKIFEYQLICLADYLIDNDLYESHKIYAFDEAIGHALTVEDVLSPCRRSILTIDSKGDFYRCLRFAKFSLRSKAPRKIGNVNNGINNNLLRPYLTMNNTTVLSKKCEDCEIASGCRWCPAENYDASVEGSIFIRATAICRIHHARVKANNYFQQRLSAIEAKRLYCL
ncbi:MAG: radical SAM peptide maturase, CXXX-repeat target family [Muribaculaceae bacterium]|nr:radical SAM peptide maturase, CXXX-repeat target family [Muribaculaceae bacterium]MBR0025334.1 radical SAM peptide maturase, CXXX-repeat target family [Muribaculaceae bacterium]